jgi:hypothetical protein
LRVSLFICAKSPQTFRKKLKKADNFKTRTAHTHKFTQWRLAKISIAALLFNIFQYNFSIVRWIVSYSCFPSLYLFKTHEFILVRARGKTFELGQKCRCSRGRSFRLRSRDANRAVELWLMRLLGAQVTLLGARRTPTEMICANARGNFQCTYL